MILTHKDSRGVSRELVSQLSHCLRKLGCRCVLDERFFVKPKGKSMKCSNRYEPLHVNECSDKDVVEDRDLNLCQVENNIQSLRVVKG